MSFVLVTVRLKVSKAVAFSASDAVILTAIIPTSLFSGVPENVRVEALKVSQVGNALPSARVAEYEIVSLTSESENTFASN